MKRGDRRKMGELRGDWDEERPEDEGCMKLTAMDRTHTENG